jgi:DNA primase
VAPRSVRLSSPERVLFPDEGITKQDLFEYYRAIAPVLVPHLRNRPFTMKRSHYGVAGDAYFQKVERLELESYVKTSGADGIHVVVPIARRATFEQTYAFAERVARGLEERHPGLVTTERARRPPSERAGEDDRLG